MSAPKVPKPPKPPPPPVSMAASQILNVGRFMKFEAKRGFAGTVAGGNALFRSGARPPTTPSTLVGK